MTCRCGHPAGAHQHYRRGSDCGLCGCRRMRRGWRRAKPVLVGVALSVAALTGCSTDADVVDRNITQEAENFQVPRRITFINGITDNYLLTIEGYCSLNSDNPAQLTVTCARNGGYIRNYLGKSDNVTWLVEQLDPARVSTSYYKVTFKPSTIIPDPELR